MVDLIAKVEQTPISDLPATIENIWKVDKYVDKKKKDIGKDYFELGQYLRYMKANDRFRQLDSEGREPMSWSEYREMKGISARMDQYSRQIARELIEDGSLDDFTLDLLREAPIGSLTTLAEKKKELQDEDKFDEAIEDAPELSQRDFNKKYNSKDKDKEPPPQEYLLINEAEIVEGDPERYKAQYDVCLKADGFVWGYETLEAESTRFLDRT